MIAWYLKYFSEVAEELTPECAKANVSDQVMVLLDRLRDVESVVSAARTEAVVLLISRESREEWS